MASSSTGTRDPSISPGLDALSQIQKHGVGCATPGQNGENNAEHADGDEHDRDCGESDGCAKDSGEG